MAFEADKMSSPAPSISVVVVVDEGDEAACMPTLKIQRYDKLFEIIVVEGGNRSQARNLAIAQSKAPLIAFIDSDCEATNEWLASLAAGLPYDHIVAGVGGVSSSQNSLPSLEKAIDGVFSTFLGNLDSPSLISLPRRQKSFVRALSGHNCIFRRSALVEVGGFDKRFKLNEDTDICARLREKGYKLILDRSIFVYHRRRDSLSNFALQFFWYGVGRMRSMLTSRRYIDKRIFGLLLATLFVTLLSPINPVLLLASLLGYFILILGSSIIGAKRIHMVRMLPKMLVLFVVEHLSYLIGLLCGIFQGPWKEVKEPKSMRIQRYLVSDGRVKGYNKSVF